VSADAFASASRKEKYRYTSVVKAIKDGTVKVPACRECLRRGTAADLADCKAVRKGRYAYCLWSRVPVLGLRPAGRGEFERGGRGGGGDRGGVMLTLSVGFRR
jgi:hypothetical protein